MRAARHEPVCDHGLVEFYELRAAIAYGAWFDMTMVPEALNMPPTPWAIEILASGTCAGAVPRIWRTLSCKAYMPYMPECI